MSKKTGKWSAWDIGKVKVRPIKPPREDGRSLCRLEWYPSGDKGEMETQGIGWVTKEEAAQRAGEVLAGGAQARQEKQRGAVQVETLSDLLRAWLWHVENERADLAPATLRIYRQSVIGLIGTKEEPRPLASVHLRTMSTAQMQRWAAEQQRLAQQGKARRSGKTLHTELGVMARAWIWGQGMGLTEGASPSVGVKIAMKPVNNRRTPTPGEVAATLARLGMWQSLTVILCWSTGARLGEIIALTWEQIDLAGGWLKLDGKTGEREVPLTAKARMALEAALERWMVKTEKATGKRPEKASGKVISNSTYLSISTALRAQIKRVCLALGIEVWTPHGLRRLAVDELQRAGVDVGTAAALLGHSPEVMLTKYRQPTAQDKLRGLEKARLGEAPAGEVREFKPGASKS